MSQSECARNMHIDYVVIFTLITNIIKYLFYICLQYYAYGMSQLANDDGTATVFDIVYNDWRVVASWVSAFVHRCTNSLLLQHMIYHSILASCFCRAVFKLTGLNAGNVKLIPTSLLIVHCWNYFCDI